jgi:ATP adenylyltransferase
MDRIHAPWRRAYVTGDSERARLPPSPSGCIFCDYPRAPAVVGEAAQAWDEERLVVTTRPAAFVLLNRFPYGAGHVMVVPRRHEENVERLPAAEFAALSALLQETIAAVRDAYRPDGVNIGMNVGAAAGAGIAAHCHWHVLPRWVGDVNFLPAFADAKVISEGLLDARARLAALLRQPGEP